MSSPVMSTLCLTGFVAKILDNSQSKWVSQLTGKMIQLGRLLPAVAPATYLGPLSDHKVLNKCVVHNLIISWLYKHVSV